MSSAMLVYSMRIPRERKPGWDKEIAEEQKVKGGEDGNDLTTAALDGQVFNELDGEYDNGPGAEAKLQETIAAHLEVVKDAIDGYGTVDYNRELGATSFGGWMVYITGGLSGGDSPTDLWDSISALDQLGLLEAAGCFDDTNAVQFLR